MAPDDDGLREVRQELIRMFEADEWEFTDRARLDGYQVLRSQNQFPTECALVDYILDLLRSDFPMHPVGLGNPPGSLGTGFVMNNADGRRLHIKLTIADNRVYVLSFHRSKHYKGA